ncbi:MAG: RAMP superfamily protein [Methanobacterium sp. PtaU1.Bin097]|nr:MAG: RAMP superfamily protein [Methanobacterium sp. PtaU1.Bin097]
MQTEVIRGNIEALSPIHHGGSESHGTIKPILALPTVVRNAETGEEEIDNIPTIHGNSIRGNLRALIMQDFLDLLDYQLDSKKVYHFLFDGGMLEAVDAKDKGAINLKMKDEIRYNIPAISLLGSALGNQMIQGKLKVGMADIVCKETSHYLPYDNEGKPNFSAYGLKGEDFGTRLDSLKEDRKEDEAATQMKYEFETLITGTRFTHEFLLEDILPHERACFIRMLNLWNERPFIGGKSGSGYGKVRLNYEYNTADEEDYLNYINDHKEEIVAQLDKMVEKWK